MAPRTERKLAAILAADVVGYSRLVGDDEAGTIARLKALRKELIEPLIAEHRGRVVKLMGDGALVEFASAVDAVECAVAIQKGVTEREAADPGKPAHRVPHRHQHRRHHRRRRRHLWRRRQRRGPTGGPRRAGRICIARNVYDQVKTKLDLGFEPMGEHRVKNIAEPITVYRVGPVRARAVRELGLALWTQRRWQAARGVAAPAFWRWRAARRGTRCGRQRAGTGRDHRGDGGLAAAEAKPALPLPDKPSIVVLPFSNLSGDAEQEYFADALTEDIITGLARFRDLFVISSNSSFRYKGQAVDIKQVGRELGVRLPSKIVSGARKIGCASLRS